MQSDKITFRLSGGLRDLLVREARRLDRSESYVVRDILETHFEAQVRTVVLHRAGVSVDAQREAAVADRERAAVGVAHRGA